MKLGLSMRGIGYHPSAWLDTSVPADGAMRFDHFLNVARIAEKAKFDFLFVADWSALVIPPGLPDAAARMCDGVAEFEPITLLAALSQMTRNIGLVATMSTSLHQPYHIARQFASLDHLSGGRAGWNIVTSSRDEEARNFGKDALPPKDIRYRMAKEAVTIARALWDGWESDAFPRDRASGIFCRLDRMTRANFKGEFFRVDGPLTIPRPPQGHPILFQAGGSPDGMRFAAEIADVIYAAKARLPDAKAFAQSIRETARQAGRRPEDVLIFPGMLPILGDTKDDARREHDRLKAILDPRTGLDVLYQYFGDLSGHDLDGRVPELRTDVPVISRGADILNAARRNNWSIRDLMQEVAISRAHNIVVGTKHDIADEMEAWFEEGAADGFNIMPALSPTSLKRFAEEVVPELQRRGLFKTEYAGPTLRDNLGLGLSP